MESITLRNPEGRELAGSLFLPPGPRPGPGLMFIHGLDSDQYGYRIRARAVVGALGVACLTFDLSGHGASGAGLDALTVRQHVADVLTAYDALGRHPAVDPTRIGICGASYGGYLAAVLTGRRVVRRLLLRAPGLYDDAVLDRPLRDRPRSSTAVAYANTVATRSLAAFAGEVLILESGGDTVIPHAVIAAYLRAAPGAQHVTLPGAPHQLTDPGLAQRYLDEIIRFFAEL